jgi:hypothetical protein
VHPKESKIIYPSGKFIIVRSIENPDDCFVYRGHSVQTTVAKFSGNGFWVCSADISGKVKVWSWDHPVLSYFVFFLLFSSHTDSIGTPDEA